MNIKELLKAKRLELHESQAEFGKRFGVSHAAISDIERGVTTSYTQAMIDLVLSGVTKTRCTACNGSGWIEKRYNLSKIRYVDTSEVKTLEPKS
jgi:transcriptional regulator with XRE-family HTH domain